MKWDATSMTTMTSWDAALAAPAPCDHLVQLYTSEPSLVGTLARFVEHGVRLDHGIVAITTAARWSAVAARLSAAGIDVAAAQSRGQLAVLDAADTLARLLVDGAPDRDAMRRAIVPAIQAARAAGYTTVRAYGDMVDLLSRRGDLAAALRLEELWKELLDAQRIALLCAYAVDPLERGAYAAALPGIGRVHSHLMPVDDLPRLERAIDLAFIDVFGLYGDARLLRDLFVRQLSDGATMPAAQAALLALREVDTRLADAVLERAAHHHRRAA